VAGVVFGPPARLGEAPRDYAVTVSQDNGGRTSLRITTKDITGRPHAASVGYKNTAISFHGVKRRGYFLGRFGSGWNDQDDLFVRNISNALASSTSITKWPGRSHHRIEPYLV
jgi:hypothetical protein